MEKDSKPGKFGSPAQICNPPKCTPQVKNAISPNSHHTKKRKVCNSNPTTTSVPCLGWGRGRTSCAWGSLCFKAHPSAARSTVESSVPRRTPTSRRCIRRRAGSTAGGLAPQNAFWHTHGLDLFADISAGTGIGIGISVVTITITIMSIVTITIYVRWC